MLSKEELDVFKKKYKEEQGKELSDDEAFTIILFENAILNTQFFIFGLEEKVGSLDVDVKINLTEDILSYSLGLIIIILSTNGKSKVIRGMIFAEYEKFIRAHSGTDNIEQNRVLYEFLYKKLQRNINILSIAFKEQEVKSVLIDKITFDIIANPEYSFSEQTIRSFVGKLILDIEKSMKHFRIISENNNPYMKSKIINMIYFTVFFLLGTYFIWIETWILPVKIIIFILLFFFLKSVSFLSSKRNKQKKEE